MKQISWDKYYCDFYEWSLSTQKSYSYRLVNFGSADEVYEIISEFTFYDPKFATRFTEKALDAGVRFSPEHVLELTSLIEKPILSRMAETTSISFNREQLEEIYMLIDDASFARISRKANIDIFDEKEMLQVEEEFEPEMIDVEPSVPKGQGFFTSLFAGISLFNSSKNHQHNGWCNGDCANCPPHYGYRYGRWYYGHNHTHGCELGGNKGSGSRD